ncbi:MAG TPA: arsenic resistance N-acetyltransferase ArsN2 [Gemmatimonadaceae bacterium]
MSTITSTIAIRHARPADLAAIEQLLTDANLPTAGVGQILHARADDFFVAEADAGATNERMLVGVAGLEVCCNNALLRSVAVRPEWRRHAVGRDLVRRIVSEAEHRGLHALYLLTTTAEQYFPRFGFERIERADVAPEIAETDEFKSACPASAIAMKKTLA